MDTVEDPSLSSSVTDGPGVSKFMRVVISRKNWFILRSSVKRKGIDWKANYFRAIAFNWLVGL